jgi:hypothetical protein
MELHDILAAPSSTTGKGSTKPSQDTNKAIVAKIYLLSSGY